MLKKEDLFIFYHVSRVKSRGLADLPGTRYQVVAYLVVDVLSMTLSALFPGRIYLFRLAIFIIPI